MQYNASAGYRSSTKGITSRAYSVSAADKEAAADLASSFLVAGTSMSNATQEATAESFAGSTPVTAGNVVASVVGSIDASGLLVPTGVFKAEEPKAEEPKSSSKKRSSKRW